MNFDVEDKFDVDIEDVDNDDRHNYIKKGPDKGIINILHRSIRIIITFVMLRRIKKWLMNWSSPFGNRVSYKIVLYQRIFKVNGFHEARIVLRPVNKIRIHVHSMNDRINVLDDKNCVYKINCNKV